MFYLSYAVPLLMIVVVVVLGVGDDFALGIEVDVCCVLIYVCYCYYPHWLQVEFIWLLWLRRSFSMCSILIDPL